ncbi:chymotrypsin-elastase inhibitor ixodidin-like [Zeugodacus cucurbitae]|uniref:chymotrypsin-elastase inhibitor ixodidin-like n=1 Tax=Zeugodacus cucurbitae TaxID=28588 RepID=UPI0010A748A5|nr:chymotrypsin-elastase inhibitor ixodidin-like [Zeugodacus cucurbitae]
MLKLLIIVAALLKFNSIVKANGGPRSCTGSRNEIYLNPGPNCERTCRNLDEECLKVYVMPPSGCYCRPGFARNEAGRCIPIRLCGRTK